MNQVYLLLGSNVGDRMDILQKAVHSISDTCGKITQISSVYETAAWGLEDQPAFLNAVICLQTLLEPLAVLRNIQQIEAVAGRQRTIKWGSRTLDIDILFYNNDIVTLPELIIPHPHLHERNFTLAPLAEIAPEFVHPLLEKTIRTLLLNSKDNLEVKKTGYHLHL